MYISMKMTYLIKKIQSKSREYVYLNLYSKVLRPTLVEGINFMPIDDELGEDNMHGYMFDKPMDEAFDSILEFEETSGYELPPITTTQLHVMGDVDYGELGEDYNSDVIITDVESNKDVNETRFRFEAYKEEILNKKFEHKIGMDFCSLQQFKEASLEWSILNEQKL
ncbi:hypothetical protein RJT34_12797 [Clitoria ternatea]|uniref:Uncharacterized protein n=1 Tax=Clitoria ternatea TaxID=43366 RepID=A0AAN9JMF2_CLITE